LRHLALAYMKRHFSHALLFMTLLAVACKKDNRITDTLLKTINGNWSLASYSGGIAGFKHRQADTNPKVTLIITDKGLYSQYNDGNLATQGNYTVLKNYPFSKSLTADALKIDNDVLGSVRLHLGNQDTLYITPLPQWPDAMTYEYVRSPIR
jgi:hypothetical protein